MPDLYQTLQDQDVEFLDHLAALNGLDTVSHEKKTLLEELVGAMHAADFLNRLPSILPPQVGHCLSILLQSSRPYSWQQFQREFGEIRRYGAARRERERPDLDPRNTAEWLWFRGLIGCAFMDVQPEPMECAYVPHEIADALRPVLLKISASSLRPADPEMIKYLIPVSDALQNHLCTLLAGLRSGRMLENLQIPEDNDFQPFLLALAVQAGFLDTSGNVQADTVKKFLEQERSVGIFHLWQVWQETPAITELCLISALVCETGCEHDPVALRTFLLDQLGQLEPGKWFNLDTFIAWIKANHPNFLRPSGDYDSWFIRDHGKQDYLRGFQHWEQVEGRLLRFLLTGPLHWLDVLDLASPDEKILPLAFRVSKRGISILGGVCPAAFPPEDEVLAIQSSGRIEASMRVSRVVRYQVARFCDWEPMAAGRYRYRITAASLQSASKQGLKATALLTLLRSNCHPALPPNLIQAIESYSHHGAQVSFQPAVVLQVSHPEILEKLEKSRAARFIDAVLTPNTALIKPGSESALEKALLELGYLSEFRLAV
jgi:hypothetical protein